MTKKVLVLSLALSTILFGCEKNSDNSGEISELQQRLDALEKGKAVTSITFDGANMILTYNTGEKVTTPIPAGIKGDKGDNGATGATGKDGVGIASITYDQTTGVLKIKLTNGNESTFQIIISADGGLSAVLLSDSNGKQLISSLYAGAAPYLEMTYDPTTFDAATAKSSEIVDGQIRKFTDVTKNYTAGKLSGATVKRYATKSQIAYTTNYLGSGSEQVSFTSNKGNFYTEGGTNGLYTLYVYSYLSGGNYIYYKYSNVYKASAALPNYNNYVKYSETVVYGTSSQITVSGSIFYWYQVYAIYTKTGVTNVGDIVSTDSYTIETNSDGLISKASNTAEPRYVTFSYNTAKKVSQCVEYINNVAGKTMNYEYNASNQLISVKQQDGATTTEMMKAEYDANGNPTKIYTYQSELYSYEYNQFDPWSNPSDPWGNGTVVRPAGMYLFATLEYTNYKNFFGNTIGSIFPGLGAYNFVNAPKRIAYANSLAFGSIEYKDFNEFGYPQTIVTNATSDEGSIRIELAANYIKKTN
jgi:YD repeat-containing protein